MMKLTLTVVTPWTFRMLCVVFGGLGLLTLAKAQGLPLAIPKGELGPLLLVSLMNVTGWHLFSAHSLVTMAAGRASILAFTMPVWAAILSSLILKERLTPRRLVGLGIGIIGIGILVGTEIKTLRSAPLGVVLMLAAAISWAAGTVFIKYFKWTMSTSLLAGWQLILGGIPIVVGALTLESMTVLLLLSKGGLLALIYVILLPIIFCQWAWFKVVSLFPATVASIGTLLIPVIGVFSSALVLGDPVGLQELASLALVITAMAVVMIKTE